MYFLNLVGHSAVNNISAASEFFELVENVYCFSASTHLWAILVDAQDGFPIIKHLGDSQLSTHADAIKALKLAFGY